MVAIGAFHNQQKVTSERTAERRAAGAGADHPPAAAAGMVCPARRAALGGLAIGAQQPPGRGRRAARRRGGEAGGLGLRRGRRRRGQGRPARRAARSSRARAAASARSRAACAAASRRGSRSMRASISVRSTEPAPGPPARGRPASRSAWRASASRWRVAAISLSRARPAASASVRAAATMVASTVAWRARRGGRPPRRPRAAPRRRGAPGGPCPAARARRAALPRAGGARPEGSRPARARGGAWPASAVPGGGAAFDLGAGGDGGEGLLRARVPAPLPARHRRAGRVRHGDALPARPRSSSAASRARRAASAAAARSASAARRASWMSSRVGWAAGAGAARRGRGPEARRAGRGGRPDRATPCCASRRVWRCPGGPRRGVARCCRDWRRGGIARRRAARHNSGAPRGAMRDGRHHGAPPCLASGTHRRRAAPHGSARPAAAVRPRDAVRGGPGLALFRRNPGPPRRAAATALSSPRAAGHPAVPAASARCRPACHPRWSCRPPRRAASRAPGWWCARCAGRGGGGSRIISALPWSAVTNSAPLAARMASAMRPRPVSTASTRASRRRGCRCGHHVGIRVVQHDQVVGARRDGGDGLVGEFGGRHLGLQVIGRDLGGRGP